MRWLLLALMLFSLSFAAGEAPDWVPIAILAVLVGLGVLIIFFLLSYLVEAEQMRGLVVSEMWQVVITGVMIAGLVGAQALALTVFGPAFGAAFGAEAGMTHIEYAQMLTQDAVDYQWGQLNEFTNLVVIPLGDLASLSGTCVVFGTYYTYAGCASLNVPFSSASFAARVMTTAILALNSQLVLINLASRFFFPVLLPFGLFLRTFHVTRGTGGLLIAFAVAFYFVYPLAVLITSGMYNEAFKAIPSLHYPDPEIDQVTPEETWELLEHVDVPSDSCDPFAVNYGFTATQINNITKPDLMDPLLFVFFIGGLFTPALNLVIALSTLRALSRVFGTEVDVSALARVS